MSYPSKCISLKHSEQQQLGPPSVSPRHTEDVQVRRGYDLSKTGQQPWYKGEQYTDEDSDGDACADKMQASADDVRMLPEIEWIEVTVKSAFGMSNWYKRQ